MTSANIIERRNQLVELTREKGRISTEEASKLFGVSNETIRQDLLFLESKHILKKVHGGAMLYDNAVIEPLAKRQSENYKAKLAIAKKAMEYVPETGGIIGMDMGSTIAILAELLASTTGNLIITNSQPVLQKMLESKNRLYCLGGEYNAHDMAYQGEQTINALKKLSLDVCFMGTSGVFNRNGICSADFHDISVKQEFIHRSLITVVLADSTKFTKSSLVEVVSWNEIDIVITDTGINSDLAAKLREYVELVIVEA